MHHAFKSTNGLFSSSLIVNITSNSRTHQTKPVKPLSIQFPQMMKPTLSPIPLVFITIIISLEHVHSIEYQQPTCPYSFTCGEFRNISYPFWTNNQPQQCGHPSFKLENCDQPNNVTINTISGSYRVIEIQPLTQTLKLSRLDFSDNICPKTFVNLTFDTILFSYTINDEYSTLLYNCQQTDTVAFYSYKFPCPINNIARDAYFEPDRFSEAGLKYPGCDIALWVPILTTSIQGLLNNSIDIYGVINRGFEVKWNIDAMQCNNCLLSGGRCGYNTTLSAFNCYCPDRNYLRICLGAQPPLPTPQQDGSAISPASHHVNGMCYLPFVYFYLFLPVND